jgi:hypothetical protein
MSGALDRVSAARALHRLLESAGAELRALGPEPLLVAAAPHKFNDADYDDYWCAVQVGTHYWEQSQFFSTASGWPGGGHVNEKTGMRFVEGEEPGFGESRLASDRIVGGRRILNRLERADWRALAEAALQREVVLALVVQFGETWFWMGDPRGGKLATVYLVHSTGIAQFAGEDGRMDHRVGEPDLVLAEQFHPEAVPHLGETAFRRFRPGVQDRKQADALGRRALAAATSVRRIASRLVLLRIGASRPPRYYYPGYRSDDYDQPSVTVGGTRFSRRFYVKQMNPYYGEDHRRRWAERFSIVDFPALEKIAVALTEEGFRAWFEASTGIDTFDHQDLHLLVTANALTLVYRTALLRIDDRGGLAWVGNLGAAIWLNDEEAALERIAALDEALVTPPV